nr:MAG TPA: hypothetical protein [Caudoviricetes sp.]DAP81545.1 MAG TPA: hypothetical protein [Caudoviricetes sp.]
MFSAIISLLPRFDILSPPLMSLIIAKQTTFFNS